MKIVITGSSSGIGRALTLSLLEAGHHIWGIARSNQNDLEALYPIHFKSCRCDVSSYTQVSESVKTITETWDTLDAIITAAGIQGEIGPTLTTDPQAWSLTVRSNIEGTYNIIRALYPNLKATSGRAKIICFSGGGATKARPAFSAYGIAKTAIVRLVETIALEERDRPLDINCIAPGAITTRLTDEVILKGPALSGKAEYDAALKQKENGGQSLQKAIGLITWLLSDQSDGISGKLISAQWDPWEKLQTHADMFTQSDIYTLRRIMPEERNYKL